MVADTCLSLAISRLMGFDRSFSRPAAAIAIGIRQGDSAFNRRCRLCAPSAAASVPGQGTGNPGGTGRRGIRSTVFRVVSKPLGVLGRDRVVSRVVGLRAVALNAGSKDCRLRLSSTADERRPLSARSTDPGDAPY